MTNTEIKDATTHLQEVASFFEGERRQMRERYDAEIAEITERERMVRDLLKSFRGGTNGSTTPRKRSKRPQTLSISEDRYRRVIQYLRDHPDGVRQVDVARNLSLNTGTVSVALELARQRKIAALAEERIDGANFWTPTERAAKRETVIKPGSAPRKGRKVAAKSK